LAASLQRRARRSGLRKASMRALVANFTGLGNGIVAVPLLRLLERRYPGIEYFHTANGVLADPSFARVAALRGLIGFTPAIWRRFSLPDWQVILRFCDEQRIDTIISFRNEGPEFDIDFYDFRRRHAERFKFLAPDLPTAGLLKPLVQTLCEMIDPAISSGELDHEWLRGVVAPTRASSCPVEIAFFTGSSLNQKRWGVDSWIALGTDLAMPPVDIISVYSGNTLEEAESAQRVVEGLLRSAPQVHIRYEAASSLWSLLTGLDRAAVVVSNDTVAVHMAAAAGRPVVGLYLCTDPAIWAPVTPRTVTCEAPARRRCERLKLHAGNCGYYGSTPPEFCGASLSAKDVAREVWVQVRLTTAP